MTDTTIEPGSCKDVLRIGVPLIFSMISHTVMQFTDRIFLGNYSMDAIAASLPAGITVYLFMCIFLGVIEYVGVFVAQYTGADHPRRVGKVVWQGIYFCLVASVLMAAIGLFAEPIFALGKHSPAVQAMEADYFRIMCYGSIFNFLGICLASFYSGRGLTWPIAAVGSVGMLINIPMDYALINGRWGFPELGITGAAIGTVIGSALSFAIYAVMVFSRKNEERYGLRSQRKLNRALLGRMLYFGVPGSIQRFLDMFGITFFIFLVGRMGIEALASTNIVISIHLLVYLPVMGLASSAAILVGQSIGSKKTWQGQRATKNSALMSVGFMAVASVIYLTLPEVMVSLFKTHDMPAEQFAVVVELSRVLLRFGAVYGLLEAPALVWLAALRGAGDTFFVMWSLLITSVAVLIIPTYLMVEYFSVDMYTLWYCLTAYVGVLSVISCMRFRHGKWKSMSVIEGTPAVAAE